MQVEEWDQEDQEVEEWEQEVEALLMLISMRSTQSMVRAPPKLRECLEAYGRSLEGCSHPPRWVAGQGAEVVMVGSGVALPPHPTHWAGDPRYCHNPAHLRLASGHIAVATLQ